MKDPENLNSYAEKAIEAAGTLYRTFEIVQQGAVPIDLVVSSVSSTVENFRHLKTELVSLSKHVSMIHEQRLNLTFFFSMSFKVMEKSRLRKLLCNSMRL